MGLFSRLFGGEHETGYLFGGETMAGPARAIPAIERISYDAQLVGNLKDDHMELVRLYSAIKTSAHKEQFHELPDLLFNFKLTFQTHIALENVRFYVYVQQHWARDTETSDFIAEVRREMNGIARAVVKFVDSHSASLPTLATVESFNAELEQIGSVLVKRVQLEESRLYSLYQPM